ncbi:MAG TPA: flagellar motor switch protein FliG [Bryobacterales bacterium]|nr:flagellar motor switch protein FliG [Bryobacterales bacterium]
MIANASRPANIIPGLRKAAITLVTLGDDVGVEIFKLLEEEEIQELSKEISKLSTVTSEQAESVMEEFHQMSLAHEYMMKGGVDYAKRVLNAAFGPDNARRIIDRLVKSIGSDVASFDSLQKADPQQVAKFIQSEHPQTIALVLSHLNASSAAAMLLALPPEVRSDVSMRMANLDQISPEIVSKIATIVDQKLKALGQFSRESYGGVRAVAELFNRLDSNASREILEQVEAQDPGLGESIRNLMFVFEDLLLIDQVGMREILSRVDKKTLTVALKGTSEQLRQHFFTYMSERGAEMLKEDMEATGAVKIREVEAAQQSIIGVVRALEAEGVISLKGQVGEQYVV